MKKENNLQLKELKVKLIESLKGYEFNEMLNILNKQTDPDVRGVILDAMELYHSEEYMVWLG